jgi:2-dehydro-3-deoxygalactonokinase
VEAPYVACPARPEHIANSCIGLWNGRAQIIPGLSCRNRFDAPDLMRGEETQILGALRLEPALESGRWLLCLPGTHTKWVLLEGGEVREFLTAPSGELFAILREHSVLLGREEPAGDIADTVAFMDGVRAFNAYPGAQLLHRLFECRSRRLSGQLDPPAAAAFLSGLLTASDVYGALTSFTTVAANAEIVLIGAQPLTALYHAALRERGCRSRRIDGAAASLAGLIHVHLQLASRSNAHAG